MSYPLYTHTHTCAHATLYGDCAYAHFHQLHSSKVELNDPSIFHTQMINLDVRLQISPFLHPDLGPAGRDGESNKSASVYQRAINPPAQSLLVKSLAITLEFYK